MTAETSETKQLAVRFPKDDYDSIEEIAEGGQYNVSKSEVVRTAVKEHIGKE